MESDEFGVIPSMPRLQIFDTNLIGGGKPLYRFTARVFADHEVGTVLGNCKICVFSRYGPLRSARQLTKTSRPLLKAWMINPTSALMMAEPVHIAQANTVLSRLRIRIELPAIWGSLPRRSADP